MKQDSFANRLQKAMDKKGLKQIDIVNKTKIDKTLINKYLSGVSEAKQDNLELLANALDTNEVWLMGYDVPFEPLNINDDNIKKIETDKGVKIYIDTNEPLTANDILEVNKVLMEELQNIDKEK